MWVYLASFISSRSAENIACSLESLFVVSATHAFLGCMLRRFVMGFTIYMHGGHLGHATWTIYILSLPLLHKRIIANRIRRMEANCCV